MSLVFYIAAAGSGRSGNAAALGRRVVPWLACGTDILSGRAGRAVPACKGLARLVPGGVLECAIRACCTVQALHQSGDS